MSCKHDWKPVNDTLICSKCGQWRLKPYRLAKHKGAK